MRKLIAVAALLVFATLTNAQAVSMPKTLTVPVQRFATVPIQSDGKQTRWLMTGDGADAIREYDPDPQRIALKVFCSKEGVYTLYAWTCKGDVLSEVATCVITAGEPTPGPTPDPGPNPGPDPFGSTAGGLKVLVVLETADAGKLPKEQLTALQSQDTLGYLNSHCATDADGKTRCWRIWDKDVNPANEATMWQKAFARPRKSLPWVIVSNGRAWTEQSLPKDKDALLALLKKYGGN